MSKNKKAISISLLVTGICCLSGFVLLGVSGLFLYFGSPFLGISDCGWDDTAIAWIDENENGIREKNERPLSGVHFIADDIRHDYDTSIEAISDENGEAWISVFPVECGKFDQIEIVVKAVAPDGYRPTTSDQVVVPEDAVQNYENDNILFGFINNGK